MTSPGNHQEIIKTCARGPLRMEINLFIKILKNKRYQQTKIDIKYFNNIRILSYFELDYKKTRLVLLKIAYKKINISIE